MALGEFELIKKYFTDIGPMQNVALGVGDDCALLDIPAGQQLATSVDTLVADIHFPVTGAAALIAQKALRSNLSDLAAMGAQPLAFTLALSLVQSDEIWLRDFAEGLRRCADEFSIALIGGDTTRSNQLVITIQVLGLVPPQQSLLRSGAQPGDLIYVSGSLGAARAALDVLSLPVSTLSNNQQYWLRRYYTPTPRVALGVALRGVASAAVDISDGFAADLGHILERSDVGAVIDAPAVPVSSSLVTHPQALEFALHGGDDYEVCFTAPRAQQGAIANMAKQLNIALSLVGEITDDKNFLLRDADGQSIPLARFGYQHF